MIQEKLKERSVAKLKQDYETADAIRDELEAFFDVHRECGSHPGGVHLEMTGKDVTECLGGDNNAVTMESMSDKYETHCDPRLNAMQSLELAFCVAEKMREAQGYEPLEY